MRHLNRFLIVNEFDTPLVLNVEPEGAFFPLASGAEVTVIDEARIHPVTIKFGRLEGGDPVVSIWPGDGECRVEKDGVDVLDLLQE